MAKKTIPELRTEIVEERANFLFLSLIEYRRELFLCIIDRVTDDTIGAYVLDFAEQEDIDSQTLLSEAIRWFYGFSDYHPLSIELSKRGFSDRVSAIYRTFDTMYVTRIVGRSFHYNEIEKSKVKRRRVVPLPDYVTIKLKKTA